MSISTPMTNFERVLEFNETFGVPPAKRADSSDPLPAAENAHGMTPHPTVFHDDPQTVERCMDLIREEYRELEDAVAADDYVETADALTDLLYVIYGMGSRIGLDMDRAFRIVHENNMAKACKSESEAKTTEELYMANPALGHQNVTHRKTKGGLYIVHDTETGKILKSHEWKDVDLGDVCGPYRTLAHEPPSPPPSKRPRTEAE